LDSPGAALYVTVDPEDEIELADAVETGRSAAAASARRALRMGFLSEFLGRSATLRGRPQRNLNVLSPGR
jgi:hypothetical protein